MSQDNIRQILRWYDDFQENDHVKIFDNQEFLYREFTVMQPLQRRGQISEETIEKAKSVPFLAKLFDEYKYQELLEMEPRSAKDEKKLQDFVAGKTKQESILTALAKGSSDKTYPNFENFAQVIKDLLGEFKLTPANVNALALAMSEMDKTAEVIRTNKKDKPNEIAGRDCLR